MTSLRFLPEQIEPWPIARLKPYERNPRMHSDGQVAKVAASIASYGWTVPLLVTEDGEVIAGHGRLLAVRHLGLTEVPVIRVTHLSPEQVRAYRVADNQLVLAGAWDEELLAAELHALNAAGFDLDLTGFDQEEIVPCKTAGEVGHAPGTIGMRRKDGSFNAWTHGGEATQPFRIPDSVIRIERHHGAVGRHLSHPAPLGEARQGRRGQARLVGAWSG